MDEIQKAVSDLENTFAEMNYPEAFLQEYEILECLSRNKGTETFLVRKDDVLYVAKCYDCTIYEFTTGEDIFKRLKHEQIPCYIGEFGNEHYRCYVREYIKGQSLDEYCRENVLSREEVTNLAISLCTVIEFLHSQTPPVIHRDIKARNIIINEAKQAVLIDFDIARTYKEGVEADTVFKGTQVYAPPEQYGFTQTDERSDIYSFGVTLRYMMTGNARENPNVRFYHPLEKIIRKCTAFAPKDRYKSITDVKKALLKANPRSRRIFALKTGLAVALLFLVLTFTGIKIYDYVTFNPFEDGHIPSVLQDEDRMADACAYLEEKFGTNMFDNIHDYATFGMMKEALVELYGMDHDYAYIGNDVDPPEESPEHFFPWPIGDEQNINRLYLCYFVTKIYWPEVVEDWSSLKDDNGEYPGCRVAYNWCEKYGILTGVTRPEDSSVGELAIALANADRVYTAMNESSK